MNESSFINTPMKMNKNREISLLPDSRQERYEAKKVLIG